MIGTYSPVSARITDRIQETATLFTLRLVFSDPKLHASYRFMPGQFNMVYLYGVGEIAISIMSDPLEFRHFDHTIRAVGRVSQGLQTLTVGNQVGLRGPFGRAWPLAEAKGKDILVLTGGLGCAPVLSVINYVMKRRNDYGNLMILQGVKHSDDFIYQQHYNEWKKHPDTTVLVAADQSGPSWPWETGRITNMLSQLELEPSNTVAMLCGPEVMMHVAIDLLRQKGLSDQAIYLSMERSMHCGTGHCGHCQLGGKFICRDGPVFSVAEIDDVLHRPGC